MLELITGAAIGAIVSIAIAEIYHRRASKETQKEINNLKILAKELQETINETKESSQYIAEQTELVKKHVVAGTSDDPDFPYK